MADLCKNKKCPLYGNCSVAYRGSACAANRAERGVDYDPDEDLNGSRYTAAEILEKWAKYAEYDPDQKAFNLLSSTFAFNTVGKRIKSLIDGYDPDGNISMLYAKKAFLDILKNQKVSVYNVVANKKYLQEEQEMYDIFTSPSVKEIEKTFLSNIDQLINRMAGQKLLMGEVSDDDGESMLSTLIDAVDAVTEELPKCHHDLFTRGGAFKPIQTISKQICVYHTVADCLINLTSAPDAAYLCYIRNNEALDGYFGIMLKSNGNTVFVNERVNESYIGEHANHRNNRWAESKKMNLFPYNEAIKSSGCDYKGYATKHGIDDNAMDLFAMAPQTYLPIVLAVIMLSSYFIKKGADALPVKYTDRLLPINSRQLDSETQTALAVIGSNGLVAAHANLDFGISTASVLNASAGARFDRHAPENEGKYLPGEAGLFTCNNQELVDIWSDGFEVDTNTLLATKTKYLTEGYGSFATIKEYEPAEFVSTEKGMAMQTYLNARYALADHMRKAMFEEYVAFGGLEAMSKWYRNALDQDSITEKAVQFLLNEETIGADYLAHDVKVYSISNKERRISYRGTVLNQEIRTDKYGSYTGMYRCNVTGAVCSSFVAFEPESWKGIEYLIGREVPKTLKGWKPRHDFIGNCILDATDPVNAVGTPYEEAERCRNALFGHTGGENEAYNRLKTDAEYRASGMNFKVAIGFSKRGLATLKKGI